MSDDLFQRFGWLQVAVQLRRTRSEGTDRRSVSSAQVRHCTSTTSVLAAWRRWNRMKKRRTEKENPPVSASIKLIPRLSFLLFVWSVCLLRIGRCTRPLAVLPNGACGKGLPLSLPCRFPVASLSLSWQGPPTCAIKRQRAVLVVDSRKKAPLHV